MKTKKLKNILGLGILFIISAGFLFFGNAKGVKAAGFCLCTANASTGHYTGALLSSTKNDYTDSECSDGCKSNGYTNGINNFTQDSKGYATVDAPIKVCLCSPKSGETKWTVANVSKTYTDETCNKECVDTGYPSGTFTNDPSMIAKTVGAGLNIPLAEANKSLTNIGGPDVCDANSSIAGVFKCLLLGVFGLVKLLLEMSATIFRWVLDVKNFNYIVDNKAIIYPIWQIVRDFLNIAFILVLLYSAFCTILQIEKYSYKKLLLNLVIMALLVNFSFPITRFIIDIANVLMYTIVNTLLGANAGDSMAFISGKSGILPTFTASQASFLGIITAIIFGFILAITLLAIGILLVIRLVALAILIIFSPLAFVATILPDVSSYSSKWWDNLFRYSFFGPIMIFVIYIATQILKNMTETQNVLTQLAGKESIDPNIAGSLAYFSIPIVLLWMGMGIAQSMSIAGAGSVMGAAQKFAKWVPKAIAHSTGIPGGFKKAAEYYGKKGAPGFLGKIPGLRGSEATENTEAGIAGFLTKGPRGYKSAQENIQRKRIAAKQKEFEDERLSETEAKAKLKSSDNVEKKAAALYLSKKDKINDSDTFSSAMDALAGDEELQKELRGKAKKDNNIKFVLEYDLDRGVKIKDKTTGKETLTKDKATIYATTLAMSSDDLAKQKSLHDDIETNGELRDYIKTTENSYITKLFEKLTPAQQKSYIARGLNPEARAKSKTATN